METLSPILLMVAFALGIVAGVFAREIAHACARTVSADKGARTSVEPADLEGIDPARLAATLQHALNFRPERRMSDAELAERRTYLEQAIANAPGWGAAVGAMEEDLSDIIDEIERRADEADGRPHLGVEEDDDA